MLYTFHGPSLQEAHVHLYFILPIAGMEVGFAFLRFGGRQEGGISLYYGARRAVALCRTGILENQHPGGDQSCSEFHNPKPGGAGVLGDPHSLLLCLCSNSALTNICR